jgi:hypothetical protein
MYVIERKYKQYIFIFSFRGILHDTVLDWEANLPEHDLERADEFCRYKPFCLLVCVFMCVWFFFNFFLFFFFCALLLT